MNRNLALSALLFAGVSLSTIPAEAGNDEKAHAAPDDQKQAPMPSHDVHWGYEGAGGPEHWGMLNEANHACGTGQQQSPIDLSGERTAALAPIAFEWNSFSPEVVNNGHTIQVNSTNGGHMVLDGKAYTLLQFHFHHGSEHTIDGHRFPLEAHFVHKAEDGNLGVIGVFFTEGAQNPALQKIWNLAPLEQGKMHADSAFQPTALIPQNQSYFRYEGSLTTPPCSQIVDWAVLSQPLEASAAQIQAFAGLFAHNYRPTQPLNRRFVLRSE